MSEGLFIVSVIVCILTHIVRAVYEVLKHRQIVQPNRTTFLVIFANMGLLWVSWCLLCGLDPHEIDLPGVVRYSGLSLFVVGILLFVVGLLTIRTLESYEGDLITRGVYSRIRHPMYLGFIFWLIGLPVFFGGISSFTLAPLFIANILLWRHFEEIELGKRFASYDDYRRTTLF
jgi:protein-S-isoprenylcysteine O-methyltransferase Ste14